MGKDNKTVIVLMKVNVFAKCSFLKVMHILMVTCSDKVGCDIYVWAQLLILGLTWILTHDLLLIN